MLHKLGHLPSRKIAEVFCKDRFTSHAEEYGLTVCFAADLTEGIDLDDPKVLSAVTEAWNDVTGAELPPDLVPAARMEEIGWCHEVKLYQKMSRAEAKEKGYPIIPVRWVDVNKGDSTNYKCRSRLVGKELKAKTKDTLMSHELFSSMPPWEMIKTLLSFLVTPQPAYI